MDAKILRELAFEVIGLGQDLKAVGPTYEQLQNAYCEDSTNVANSIADFSEKAATITAALTNTASSDAMTAAKAAAYDRVKQVADSFVRNFTQGIGCIPNEVELTKHLEESQRALASFKRIEANAQSMNLSTEQYALLLSNQVTQLAQQLQQKDVEVAHMRQQIQQKDAEITQLKAAQVPAPTP